VSKITRGLGFSSAAAALALFALTAQAQQKAPEKKPAAKAPACNTIKAQAGCEARKDDCNWVAAAVDPKTKKQTKAAYCRANPKQPAKKEPAKK
jgi:hypothetical protein